MLRLNITQEKELTFEVQIGGVVDYDKLESFFRITIEGVEYGFPAKVRSDTISLTLPPLNKIVGPPIKEGDEAEIKLEVIADGHYLTPWKDRAKMSNPLVVEATIKDDSFVSKPKFETKLIVDDGGEKQKVTVQEKEVNPTEEVAEKVIKKMIELFGSQLEQVGPAPLKGEGADGKIDQEEEEEKSTPTSEDVDNLLTETIKKFKLDEIKKPKKERKQITLKEFKQNLTKDDIYKYMHRAGTTNEKIKDIVYEQAVVLATSAEPIEILKQVIKVMKKKK